MDSEQLDALWDWSNVKVSEQRFRDVGTPEAMTQVARALGLQGKFGEAHKLLDSIDNADPLIGLRVVLERGRIFNDTNSRDEAMECFKKALETGLQIGEECYAVDAMHMIAILEDNLEAHRAAIAMAENSKDPRAKQWDATLYNNFGWTLFERGQNEEALKCMQIAVERRLRAGREERVHVARWCVARVLRELKRYDEALEILYPLLESENDGFVYDEIGECLLAQGNLEAARPYFDEAAITLPFEGLRSQRRAELGRAGRFAEIGDNSITIRRAFLADSLLLWGHFVMPELLKKWLGTVVRTGGMDPPHGQLSRGVIFDLHIDNDPNDVVKCVVETCVYPRHMVLRWNDSTLSIDVVENTLTLTHSGIEDLALYGAAWHSSIDLMSHVAAGGSRESFVENYEALLPEYRRLISRIQRRGTR